MTLIKQNKELNMRKSTYTPSTEDVKTADMLFGTCPEAKKLFLEGKKDEAGRVLVAKINADNEKKWNAESFTERLDRLTADGNPFKLIDLVFPNDKLVIKTTPNCISSSLSIEYTNENKSDKVQYFSLNNRIEVWTFLKKINELATVEVMYQVWDEDGKTSTEIPFVDSKPYAYRF